MFETFDTEYGLITLYKNDVHFISEFRKRGYWDIDTLKRLKDYIDPKRNILEIGGHCGESSIFYSSCISSENRLYVYEPQVNMYNLLVKNIKQNNLEGKIIPSNMGIFCYEGSGKMHNIDVDKGKFSDSGGIVSRRYNEESDKNCNFGGISLGGDGEDVKLTTIDNLKLDNIGYIHCDAQGSEPFIFSKALETIEKFRPVILYENPKNTHSYLYDIVCKCYPDYKEESEFDLKEYCMNELKYSNCIDKFTKHDTLLIP
tara:strand:+ start:3193 stop:3966 length:774 start_codon:yes stop_codon:yes gene_type:complete